MLIRQLRHFSPPLIFAAFAMRHHFRRHAAIAAIADAAAFCLHYASVAFH